MLLPLLIIVPAILAAAIMAYGTHPAWAQYPWGIELICLGRRLQWLTAFGSLILCLVLLGLVISGRRRVYWLIGLAPVLALFMVKFSSKFNPPRLVLDKPVFVEPTHPSAPRDEEWVVGVEFEDNAYALPYRLLNAAPVVEITDYDKRMLLIWNEPANRATAFTLLREFRPRDLEIVGSPANSLLVYDRRLGQFICGVTGRTADGEKPVGFVSPVATERTTWARWKSRHPKTGVLTHHIASGLAEPILPRYPMPPVDDALPPEATITYIATTQPSAIPSGIPAPQPVNAVAGRTRILLLRDPKTGQLRVFDRQVEEDLFLTFQPKPYRRTPEAVMIDTDTGSAWTPAGRAVEGPLQGHKLREIATEDLLYWGVMKFWEPQLQLIAPPVTQPAVTDSP